MTNEMRQHIRRERNILVRRIRWTDSMRERGWRRAEIYAQRRAAKEAGI
jgi:hypothetical protein